MAENIHVHSPIDESVVGSVPRMSSADVDASYRRLAASHAAWAAEGFEGRGQQLLQAADLLRSNVEELADLLVLEIAKTPKEATDEINRSADLIRATVEQASAIETITIKSEEFPGTPGGREQTVIRVPLGVVLAVAPFNYPINLAVSKLAPALMMGNTVLFKPPTQGSVTGRRMVELWHAAGLFKETLEVVTGKSSEIGESLVTNAALKMISLTGSTKTGKAIAEQAGMVQLMMELGGNDAALVLKDADLQLAARHIAGGAFKYAGQRCTGVKRVYVEESVAEEFTEQLVTETTRLFGSAGDPREHPIGPVISDAQADYLSELLADAVSGGGQVRCGGGHQGRVFEATIIDNLAHTSRLVAEEQFGPLLPVVKVADVDEAITCANDSPYGLQASVFTQDQELAASLADQLEVGGVHINGPDQRGPDNFMFVGHKDSGLTPQGIRFALEDMSTLKGVVHNHAEK